MSLSISRAVLRQSTKLPGRTARRFESSTTAKASEAAKDTASKASQTAADYKSKASEGLSKVTSSAGPAISNAAQSLGNALGKIGGRTGKLIKFVERQIPPTVYYARVGLELSKIVFQGQKMSPPPVSAFQSYYQRLLQIARNPGPAISQASNTVSQLRSNLNTAKVVSGSVIVAELLGFWTVGEMIGRFKLVGYHGDTGAHH
ncbi:ATP synthase subunit g, mitochondrial [Lachnellula hyalina]|uniref:ATP synthase subunit g, mitochondrial n=1 Tax=Lachnellula hyalina TaxID=1316788 RepID=A0A8H8QUZ9_9HELO|nr:ATP synthase subunit g, mitochondrial [Lachnellula hyalina]TVY23011.1 ATP synthase subunit g, mitochondrial [Lachnellula hyalina]